MVFFFEELNYVIKYDFILFLLISLTNIFINFLFWSVHEHSNHMMCVLFIISTNVVHIIHISTYYGKSNLFGLLKMYHKDNKTINIAYNMLNKIIYK